jgi:hypothetical protein
MSPHDPHEEDLRRLLHDAADDARPVGDFGRVRAAAVRPSGQRWLGPVVGVAAAVAVVLGGVALVAQLQQRSPSSSVDDGTGPVAPRTSPSGPGRTITVQTWFVGSTAQGPRLFPETHVIKGVHSTNLDAAVSEAVEVGPMDPDLTAWPGDGLSTFATSDGGTIVVDLSRDLPRPAGVSEAQARMMLQSVVWTTAGAGGGAEPVRFTVQGRPVGSLLGVPLGAPLWKTSVDDTLSPIYTTSPQQGDVVGTTFTVQGRANAPEANVAWELEQGSRTVQQGFTTARECCVLSPFSFEVQASPGTYTLVVHDTDESDGEGRGTTEDTTEIVVR